MAQTRKRRRRKRRGTQGGSIDRRSRGPRPRSRAEARSRARKQMGSKKAVDRRDRPPSWSSALQRGLFGAVIFAALLILVFKQPVGTSAPLSVFMLAVYVPLGYSIDRFFYTRRQASKQRARERDR